MDMLDRIVGVDAPLRSLKLSEAMCVQSLHGFFPAISGPFPESRAGLRSKVSVFDEAA